MLRRLVPIARFVYEHTPILFFRRVYFKIFLAVVRGKNIISRIDGMVFELDLGEMIDACVYLQKYEPDVTDAIEQYCQEGWYIVDIGANIGVHCLRFAKKVGSLGRVFAFEPTDYAYNKLVRNISLNEFANRIQTFKVFLADVNISSQEISIKSSWRSDGKHLIEENLVDFRRLDDWLLESCISKVDLIKIDVDGNEYPVLNGARRILHAFHPTVFIEVGAWHFENPAKNPLILLAEIGYRFWDMRSYVEYAGLDEIRRQLPAEDKEMGFSINLMATTKVLSPAPYCYGSLRPRRQVMIGHPSQSGKLEGKQADQ